jgi:DMSO/TMAO reductase YedYZ molybdopterin-dependent catalytic subunit
MKRFASTSAALILPLLLLAGPDTAAVHVLRPHCDTRLSMEQLHTLPLHDVRVIERDGSEAIYQGAWLGDVLDLGCDSAAHLDKHGSLRAVVKVTGADGFVAVVALAEAMPDFSDHPVMLAWQRNGEALSERHGPFQLVLADNRKPGRNVRQVKCLEVIQP